MLRDQLVNVSASSTAVRRRPRLGAGGDRRPPGHDLAGRRGGRRPDPGPDVDRRAARPGDPALARPSGSSLPADPGRGGAPRRPAGRATRRVRPGELDPFRATRVSVRVVDQERAYGRSRGGDLEPLPVGVSELRLPGTGLLPLTLSDTAVDIGCGFGPTLRVGETLFASSVTASPRQLFDAEPLPARACGPETVGLDAPTTRVVAAPAPAFRPTAVTFARPGAAAPAAASPASVTPASAVEATLDVTGAGGGVVAVRHNVNRGWRAESPDGSSAPPLVVDGWQQGWHVADDVESLDLRYVPDRAYRAALAVGGLLLVLLALGTLLLRRRRRRRARRVRSPAAPGWRPGSCRSPVCAHWASSAGGGASRQRSPARRRRSSPAGGWPHPRWRGSPGCPWWSRDSVYWWRPLGSADGWAGALVLPQLLVAVALGALVSLDLDLTRPARRAGAAPGARPRGEGPPTPPATPQG